MNLMVVSEKYKYLIIAVHDTLEVYKFDYHKLKFDSQNEQSTQIKGKPLHTITLDNDQ